MRVHGEIEFEFRDEQGTGEFIACGKVLSLLRKHLAQGETDQAAMLLASCAENVGDELLRDVLAGKPSRQMMAALTDMFVKARDFPRAALCAEHGGDVTMAARLLEENYELQRAAEFYVRANQLPKAASLLERVGDFSRAAELFSRLKNYLRAAENLERAERFFEAGQLYGAAQRWDKVVEVLQKVPSTDPEYVRAARLLGTVLERSGNTPMAMGIYGEVVRSRRIDSQTVDLHLRLAQLCAAQGLREDSRRLLDGVLAFDPRHEEALALASRLVAAPNPSPRPGPNPRDSLDDIDIQVEGRPHDRVVGVDRDFEFLRHVPLFSRLSLGELKQVHNACEKILYPRGFRLIAQGSVGEALYVIIRGSVDVAITTAQGRPSHVGSLSSGAHVGEMSLVDDSPTSADVTAREDVLAFRLPRERFQELLASNERLQLRIYEALVETLVTRLRETNAKLLEDGRAAAGGGRPAAPRC